MTLSLFDTGPTFPAILADPNWQERGGGGRGAQEHYELADQQTIVRTIRTSPLFRPTEHAHLWIWCTSNFLGDGIALYDALGFRFVRDFVWVKGADDLEEMSGEDLEGHEADLDIGIGQYARGSHEMLLFGVRGKGQHASVWNGARNIRSVFFGRVPRDPETGQRIHSRKPDASYRLIERVSRGPYAELYARRKWGPDWHVWGNQLEGQR